MRIGSPKAFGLDRSQCVPILGPVARSFSSDAAFLAIDESGTGTFCASQGFFLPEAHAWGETSNTRGSRRARVRGDDEALAPK